MTCFLGESFGGKWAAQDAQAKKTSILKQISQIFADGNDLGQYVVEATRVSIDKRRVLGAGVAPTPRYRLGFLPMDGMLYVLRLVICSLLALTAAKFGEATWKMPCGG